MFSRALGAMLIMMGFCVLVSLVWPFETPELVMKFLNIPLHAPWPTISFVVALFEIPVPQWSLNVLEFLWYGGPEELVWISMRK